MFIFWRTSNFLGLVVQSAESYQQLLDRLKYLAQIQGTLGDREGLAEHDQGQGQSAIAALAALRTKLDG